MKAARMSTNSVSTVTPAVSSTGFTRPATAPARRLLRALVAERTTILATPAARVLVVASVLMAVASMSANVASADDLASSGVVRTAMHASTVATLVFALVAGVYSATSDFRFGVAAQRALGETRRSILLAAKTVVAAGAGLIYGILGALAAVIAATVAFSARGASFDATAEAVNRALIGVVIGAALFAILGVAIGTLVRNQPFALSGVLAWMFIVEPTALLGLPELGRWLPGAAGLALTNSPDDALMSQVGGGVVLALYTSIAVVLAAIRFQRMDL